MDVPRARQLSRPSFLNTRTALGVLLFCVAAIAGQRVLESARTTIPVWSAARDLASGASLTSADLRAVEVKLPPNLMTRYAVASSDLEGARLSRSVAAGELIPRDALAEQVAPDGRRAITIPLSAEHGVGGALAPGDRVDVLATFDAADVRARTVPIVREAEVVDIVHATGLVVEDSSLIGVTLAVSPQQAARLAFAQRAGEIDIARVDAPEASEPAQTVRASDFQ